MLQQTRKDRLLLPRLWREIKTNPALCAQNPGSCCSFSNKLISKTNITLLFKWRQYSACISALGGLNIILIKYRLFGRLPYVVFLFQLTHFCMPLPVSTVRLTSKKQFDGVITSYSNHREEFVYL